MTERQTVAGAYDAIAETDNKIETHEAVCAERYSRINEVLSELKEGAKKQSTLQWGILIAVAGWLATTLFTTTVERFTANQPHPVEIHAGPE